MTGSMTVLYFVINPGFLWISLIYSWESAFQSFPTKKKEKNVISFQSKFSKIQVGFDSDWRMCCGDFDLFFQWSNCPKLHEVEYLWNKIPLCDHFLQDLQHIQSESNTIHPQRSSIFRSIVTKVWILNLESVCVFWIHLWLTCKGWWISPTKWTRKASGEGSIVSQLLLFTKWGGVTVKMCV